MRKVFLYILCAVVITYALPASTNAATQCVTFNDRQVCEEVPDSVDATDPAAADETAPPPASTAFAFQREGIFGCTAGNFGGNPGATAAIGGVYVPVNDAAVTLDAGILVYKECVLRGIVDRMRESATASYGKGGLNAFLTGRDGKPLFPQIIAKDKLAESDRVVLLDLENGTLDALHRSLKGPVSRAVARGYMQATRKSTNDFMCPYSGDLEDVWDNTAPEEDFWVAMTALQNPACNPLFAYTIASAHVNRDAASAVNDMMTRLEWGNGIYDVQTIDEDGNIVTQTPSSIVGGNINQLLQSGYKQLEGANDIDQMIGALFAGITSHVLGDSRGLAGLLTASGSQPSYLDQVVKESAQGLRNAATNAALQILNTSRTVEAAYNQAVTGIVNSFTSTMAGLRAQERACWNVVIDKECATPLAADKTCTAKPRPCTIDPLTQIQTCPPPEKLLVATSTVFSQQVIDSQIAPLVPTVTAQVNTSNKALSLLNQLIVGVTNTASLDAQRVALQQLDNLVAQKLLHTQYDAKDAQQSRDTIEATMKTLLEDTLKAWADSPVFEGNVGWCNVNNQKVVDFWHDRWLKK